MIIQAGGFKVKVEVQTLDENMQTVVTDSEAQGTHDSAAIPELAEALARIVKIRIEDRCK